MEKLSLGELFSVFGDAVEYSELANESFDCYMAGAIARQDDVLHQLITRKLKDLVARFLNSANIDKELATFPITDSDFSFEIETNGIRQLIQRPRMYYVSNDGDDYLWVYFEVRPNMKQVKKFILLDIILHTNKELDDTLYKNKKAKGHR